MPIIAEIQDKKSDQKLTQRLGEIVGYAQDLASKISDQKSCDSAGRFLIETDKSKKEVIEQHKSYKSKVHAAHKEICAKEKEMLNPLLDAESIIKKAMVQWIEKRDAAIAEENRKRQEEERKILEDERLKEAEQAQKEGEHEAATAILEQPFVPVMVESPKPRTEGISSISYVFEGVVVSVRDLCQAVIDKKVSESAIKADLTGINRIIRANNGNVQIPGVRIIKKAVVRKSYK